MNSFFHCRWPGAAITVLMALILFGDFFSQTVVKICSSLFLVLSPCLVIRIISVFIVLVTSPMIKVIIMIEATITRCYLSPRFFCIDATFLCEFESNKI